jgi:hypothetical protein
MAASAPGAAEPEPAPTGASTGAAGAGGEVEEQAVSRSNKTVTVPVAGPPKLVGGFRSLKSIRRYRFHGLSLEESRKREGILGVYGVESLGEIFEFIQDDLPELQLWKHLILK